jgi:lipopolysaccharide biosynthesis glycosyltransferase
MEKKIIVVITYKTLYFFTRICIASVRYFYPDADIYIIKDNLAGEFDTTELERALNVKQLDLGTDKYGWSAAKVHLLASDKFNGQRVLSIDCDIVLAGRFLDDLYKQTEGADFVVDSDYTADVSSEEFKRHYYAIDTIEKMDPDFKYPGYVFNGGQAIVTTGKVTKELLAPYFDVSTFPYYKRRDILPQADQSLLNYLLPTLEQQGKIKIAPVNFMLWSDELKTAALSLEKIKEGKDYPYVIHWAGVLRIPYLDAMTRPDILHFFQDYYYSKVPFGGFIKRARALVDTSDYYLRNLYRKTIKPIIKK